MSTAAAIAAVTAVLKDLLLNSFVDHDASAMVGNVMVTARAPDTITLPEQNSQLNLFLYQISPNSGWRNVGLPARDSTGDLISAPPLAVDLHYLLSAYGAKDFHAEVLLGYAMQLFHEMPVLSRETIRKSLSPTMPVDIDAGPQGNIPVELRNLFECGLAEQFEQIKVTPSYLNLEEMFRVWMSFQVPYRTTISYCVSVVLIESKRKGKVALPVRNRSLHAVPFAFPVIEDVMSQSAPDQPFLRQPILATFRLALSGKNLQSSDTRIEVSGLEVADAGLLLSDERIEFDLPAGLRAGAHFVRVVHALDLATPPATLAPHKVMESNSISFVVSPTIGNVQCHDVVGAGQNAELLRSGKIVFAIAPAVTTTQRVILILNQTELPNSQQAKGYRFECRSHNHSGASPLSSSLEVPFVGVSQGSYLVRVQVDGAESQLATDIEGRFIAPKIEVP